MLGQALLIFDQPYQDPPRGIRALQEAAQKANREAAQYLANLYLVGKFVTKDVAQAEKWLDQAEDNPKSWYLRGLCRLERNDLDTAIEILDRSAKAGYQPAKRAVQQASLMRQNKVILGNESERWDREVRALEKNYESKYFQKR